MKKLNSLTNLFTEDKKSRIMKFKDGVSVLWKRTQDGPSLRRTCSESFLFSGDLVQRLKNANKAERSNENFTLRRTVKVEHNGTLRPTRTEVIPVKPCLRREEQNSQSTPSPNCRRVSFSMYALILSAASQNSVFELQELLDKKPSYINKPSSSGETALHKAAAKGSLDCVKLLIQRGANVNLVDKQGRTPLLIAWESGHLECHKYMLTSLKQSHRD
ncbi:hypothetical protein ACROYT_G036347 [Oculina patagonica]